MNLYNATRFATGYSLGIQKSGRNCLVMVAKATYVLPSKNGESVQLAEEQIGPYETDAYTGEPGYSAPIYENDYATHKPKCDVLLLGSAYATKGEPTQERIVSLELNSQKGSINKSFKVIGSRHWKLGVLNWEASTPEEFIKQTISYDMAYGGSDPVPKKREEDEQTYTSFMQNPVGLGFYPNQKEARKKLPLPLTEALDQYGSKVKAKYQAKSFGPIARNWQPRSKLGGSYDDYWEENTKPFLPDDFDELYYQCAPEDQQLPHLIGGEEITLIGLTPNNFARFTLPNENVPMQAILSNGDRHNLSPVIDTVIIEPDEQRFTMVWRARIGLKRSVHEVDTLIIGKPTPAWERARMLDKLYLPLDQLNAFRKRMQKRYEEEERIRENNNKGKDNGE